MQYNEEELIKSCQGGNNEAFGLLYDHHIKVIYNFVYYKTRHKETAEDITSQTFFKALRSIQSVDPTKPLVSWLYKIAHNTVLDHYRTSRSMLDIDEMVDIMDTHDVISHLDDDREAVRVKQHLQNLSGIERDIVTMRIWQDLSYREIADILGKSEASCKMMYSRSLKKLRRLYE
jgi:RNA polymerase sigma-70 factor (ECF subfamily)